MHKNAYCKRKNSEILIYLSTNMNEISLLITENFNNHLGRLWKTDFTSIVEGLNAD